MKLPNAAAALVPCAKIVDYLLSPTHPLGRGKAGFFRRFGFQRETWQTLADALLQHATDHKVSAIEESPFGRRYIIEGALQAADGRRPQVRTIWFIETDHELPRFVTAYPLKRVE